MKLCEIETQKTGYSLRAIGVGSPAEALLVLPSKYVDLRAAHRAVLKVPLDGVTRLFAATLVRKDGFDKDKNPTRSLNPRRLVLNLQFVDCSMQVSIFGATFEWSYVSAGTELIFLSTLERIRDDLLVLKGVELQTVTGRARPIYTGIGGKIAGSVVDRAVQEAALDQSAMTAAAKLIRQCAIASTIIGEYGFPSTDTFLFDLHRPLRPELGDRALAAAREVCIEQVRSYSTRLPARGPASGSIDSALIARVKSQPEVLSEGQRVALNRIRVAMNSGGSSRVLLNGDVGSGKTLVFLLAAAALCGTALPNGTWQRAAIMAPSDLVARQIFAQCLTRFPDLDPSLVCAGSPRPVNSSRLLIGTQALLHADDLGPFGLVVVDEQHKFSVAQRASLVGPDTHVIEASATPIPRSLAMALFDGWTEARIQGVPVKKSIRTHLVESSNRAGIAKSVNAAIQRNERVVFLYPSVASGESSCTAAAVRLSNHFEGQVSMVHGKLKQSEKDAAMQRFKSGETPVLVASTVIEVGVDIPDITVMVVNEADRFGAAQLHQIRGRLVRNGGTADCFLVVSKTLRPASGAVASDDSGSGVKVPKALSTDTKERLQAVRDNLDGFALAERDLSIRGFGEVLGDAQTGATETLFKLPRLEPKDFVRR